MAASELPSDCERPQDEDDRTIVGRDSATGEVVIDFAADIPNVRMPPAAAINMGLLILKYAGCGNSAHEIGAYLLGAGMSGAGKHQIN